MKLNCFNKSLCLILCSFLLLQLIGCCDKNEHKSVSGSVDKKSVVAGKAPTDNDISDKSSELIKNTGLSYSINRQPTVAKPTSVNNDFFGQKYLDGVKKLEAGNYDDALKTFRELMEHYPNGEEASVAALCIAEIYFRNKNNDAALEMYRQIVEQFPGTQAAINAAEGIKYLETFAEHEKNFISPEAEDRNRRGR